ncbi:glycosyltransferase family 4 protein [bacterium]|nr:glycosyltransferase family 4 protein [bacterium]
MHIVIVHRGMYPERIGGTYSYVYELGKRLASRGHRLDVIVTTRSPVADTVTELDGITVHAYAHRRGNPVYSTLQHLRRIGRIFREISANEPVDILSVHESLLGYGLARDSVGRSVCQVPTFHAPIFLEYRLNTSWSVKAEPSLLRRARMRLTEPALERWQWRFENGVLKAGDGILVLSKYSRGHIANHFPSVDLSKVTIIPSGVDSERFRPAEDREDVRRRLGLARDSLQLVTVRNLQPRMGLENLVEAMPEILSASASRGATAELTICGEGPLRGSLEARIGELGVAQSVRLAGRVSDDDLVRHYQAADLFVLPTETMEGFGISTVEALSANVPVVGTPAGATPEILSAIDQRLVTADTTSGAIAAAVVGWLDWRVADAGSMRYRDEVLAKYTWEHVTDRIESYYSDMVREWKRRSSGV